MQAPAGNTAAPASALPSAGSLQICSAAKSICAVRPARAVRLCCICRSNIPARRLRLALLQSPYNTTPALQVVAQERVIEALADDRLDLEPGDTILLIVEDDPHYARVLIDLARDKGFKV